MPTAAAVLLRGKFRPPMWALVLQRALEKGMFRYPGDGCTNMLAITRIALQLARVIHDFHRQGLVHLVRFLPTASLVT